MRPGVKAKSDPRLKVKPAKPAPQSKPKALRLGHNQSAATYKAREPRGRQLARSTDVGRRNSRTALRFFLAVAFGLCALGLYSRHQGSDPASLSLQGFVASRAADGSLVDPLALVDDSGFKLLSVSPDGRIIGYTSDLNTGQAAVQLLLLLSDQGWQQDYAPIAGREDANCELASRGVVGDSVPGALSPDDAWAMADGITSPVAFTLTHHDVEGLPDQQMLVQLFPTGSGSSIVITAY